jgi:uncharacterized protein
MSQENVEIVRRIFDGWSRGDFSVGADLVTPDFECQQHAEAVEPGSRRGDAVGDSMRKIFEIYSDFRVEAEEFIDAGERVLVVARSRAVARGSGVAVDQPFWFVWTLRDGRLARHEVYADRRAALEAAGVEEPVLRAPAATAAAAARRAPEAAGARPRRQAAGRRSGAPPRRATPG